MWKGRLIFLCAAAYVAGCLLCGLLTVSPIAVFSAFVLISILLGICAVGFFSSMPTGRLLLPSALLFLFACGSANATLSQPSSRLLEFCDTADSGRAERISCEMDICGIVVGRGVASKGKPRLELQAGRERLYLYVEADSIDAELWDTVRCRVRVRPAENFSSDFDYVKFLARKGIFVTAYAPGSKVFITRRVMRTKAGALIRKAAGHDFSPKVLRGDELATLKSLLVGDKEGLSAELKESYRKSGAMHLLAVSGLHVGIIYLIISKLLALIPGNGKRMRRGKSIAAIAALCFYAWICGLAPSVCRAVLMAAIYEAGRSIENRENSLGAISASGLLICIFAPAAPLSVSFQLSFSAVLGIRLVYPWLSKMFQSKSKILSYIWQVAAMSISCQVGTAAITWYHFRTFPRHFLLTNLIAIPLVTMIMYSAFPALAISAIPWTDGFSLKILQFLISLLNNFIKIVGDI